MNKMIMQQIDKPSVHTYETATSAAVEYVNRIKKAQGFDSVATAFGVQLTDRGECLEDLQKFTSDFLDFRKGRERQEVAPVKLTEQQTEAIMTLAHELGMDRATEPTRNSYEFATVLGGADQSNLLRVQYLKEQIEKHELDIPHVVLLGSARDLSDAEKANTTNYAPGAKTEFDLLNGAMETIFGVVGHAERWMDFSNRNTNDPKNLWKVRVYSLSDDTQVLSVSAPQIEGAKRVNTADTYHFMNEVIGPEYLNGSHVLNVTTDLYVPFQHPDALRLLGLPSGAVVETIGFGGVDKPASIYAQEINSAIKQTALLSKAIKYFVKT
ncbi:hypothetical protein IPO96_01565 [Candidatus Saccharibacteria bacterium]|jgi:hypothetical protein|nr:MAG: hypothetical protein IPO96_01565 [Candidatus Saccharibacteria bacterium]